MGSRRCWELLHWMWGSKGIRAESLSVLMQVLEPMQKKKTKKHQDYTNTGGSKKNQLEWWDENRMEEKIKFRLCTVNPLTPEGCQRRSSSLRICVSRLYTKPLLRLSCSVWASINDEVDRVCHPGIQGVYSYDDEGTGMRFWYTSKRQCPKSFAVRRKCSSSPDHPIGEGGRLMVMITKYLPT